MAFKSNHYSVPPGYPQNGPGVYDQLKWWVTSDRGPSGKLDLRAQPFRSERRTNNRQVNTHDDRWFGDVFPDVRSGLDFASTVGLRYNNEGDSWGPLYNEAYARFRGKLYKGGASLGVTLGGLQQSREMISSRSQKLANFTSSILRKKELRARRVKPGRWRDVANARASDVLETEFGWVPLIQDIHSALFTACDTPRSPFIRARAKSPIYNRDEEYYSNYLTVKEAGGTAWVTIAGSAVIDNPNLWLLNRLGLINPAVVAWDLVPWSFVVNMFVNVNAILQSMTDFVGLEFRDLSVTRRCDTNYTMLRTWRDQPGIYYQSVTERRAYRSVGGSLPRPSLQFQLPKGNWELGLIASALAVQNVRKIGALASGVKALF